MGDDKPELTVGLREGKKEQCAGGYKASACLYAYICKIFYHLSIMRNIIFEAVVLLFPLSLFLRSAVPTNLRRLFCVYVRGGFGCEKGWRDAGSVVISGQNTYAITLEYTPRTLELMCEQNLRRESSCFKRTFSYIILGSHQPVPKASCLKERRSRSTLPVFLASSRRT